MSWEEVEGVFSAASSTPLACTQQCRPNKRPGQVTRDTAQVAVNMADGAGVSGGLRLIAAATPFPLAAPETMHAAVGRAEHVMQGVPLAEPPHRTDRLHVDIINLDHTRSRPAVKRQQQVSLHRLRRTRHQDYSGAVFHDSD